MTVQTIESLVIAAPRHITTRLRKELLTFRRSFFDLLPVALQPLDFDSISVHDHCVMVAKCVRAVPDPPARVAYARKAKAKPAVKADVSPKTPGQISRVIITDRFASFIGDNGKRTLPDHIAVALKVCSC